MTPEKAYFKAKKEGPEDLTRNIACQSTRYAYYYALDVDKKPSKQTRDAACQSSRYAYCYAIDVDKEPLQETWRAVLNTPYEKNYTNWADKIENVDKHI